MTLSFTLLHDCGPRPVLTSPYLGMLEKSERDEKVGMDQIRKCQNAVPSPSSDWTVTSYDAVCGKLW